MSEGLTRRSFIAAAGVLGGAAAVAGLGGCASSKSAATEPAEPTLAEGTHIYGKWRIAPDPIPDDKIVGTVDCDIVVCGAGVSGLPAAAYAAEQGATVHVIEKGGRWGQHRLSTAGFNAECQKRFGLNFDRKSLVTEMWKISNGNQAMITHYGRWFDNSGDYVNWLEGIFNKGGWQLVSIAAAGPGALASFSGAGNIWWPGFPSMVLFVDPEGMMFLNGGNPDWTGYMADYAAKAGATFHYNTAGVQLIKDGSGRVTSIIAQDEIGDYYRYNASKGIILSTGDVGGAEEILQDHGQNLAKVAVWVSETKNTGDGHKMGVWIGAEMDHVIAGDLFPYITPHSPREINSMGVRDVNNPMFLAGINLGWRPAVSSLPVLMVDGAGRRVAAEDLPFQSYSIATLSTYNGRVWSIWDSAWQTKFPQPFSPGDLLCINSQEQLDLEVEKGITLKFDTIEALIAGTGMDEETFTETLNRYHELCALGEDLDCYKQPQWLTTIDAPPFYASQLGTFIDSTRGGLKTDDRSRVLDTQGRVMPGLYAAGNTAGSFYGEVYPPNVMSSGIGHGQCFGWLAVKDMLGIEYK